MKFKRVCAAAVMLCVLTVAGGRPAAASTDVSLLDLVETEYGYTTIADQYQHPVSAQRLLDGARVGLVAYLHSRGISEPQVAMMHARADGRGAVPAISQQIGLAIQRYGSRVDTLALVYAAIRGEVAALRDPYSVFFTAADVKGFSAAIDGTSFGGIGVQLAFDDAHKSWLADTVFEGSPAARAGLLAGDTIVAVDGTNLSGLDNAHVQSLIRGPIGTTARLSIVRGGAPLDAPLAIVRAAVTPPDVTERMLPRHRRLRRVALLRPGCGYQSARRAVAFGEGRSEGVRLRSARQRRRV